MWICSDTLANTVLFQRVKNAPSQVAQIFSYAVTLKSHRRRRLYLQGGDIALEAYLLFKVRCEFGNGSAGIGQPDREGFRWQQ